MRIAVLMADSALFSSTVKRRASALARPDMSQLSDSTARSVAEKYLGMGEFIFDSSVAAAHASRYFGSTHATASAPLPPGLDRFEKPQPQQSGGGWFK